MKKYLFMISAFIGLGALIGSFIYKPADIQSQNAAKHTYLALGDYYVLGEGVDEHERWPIQLEAALRGHEYHINYPYFVANKTWTVDQLTARLNEEEFDKHYDLITIQIGVNDEFKKKSPAQFGKDFKTLLDKVVTLTGGKHGRIVVLSIPDWSATPYARSKKSDQLDAIAASIDKYNQIIKKETIEIGGHYVDVTELSKKAASNPNLTSPDGLHPSGEMYKTWVDLMYPVVLKALQMHRK